jgi:hypothetical protein
MTQALNIINTALDFLSSTIDRIGVYDESYNQVFKKARPLKVTVTEDSKLMEHPLESGAETVDHRIILPREIELVLVLSSYDRRDVYEEIRQLWEDAQHLIVQTNSGVYENQVIKALPHEEKSEHYNSLFLILKLKEVMFADTAVVEVQPKQAKNKPKVDKGQQQPQEASAENTKRSSVLFRSFN